ncbi:DUF397 domain-containing protein [Streptomyces sp. URMC 126]|uniref:DUF397 domain-containing protein n=1 Tax=Streptomyces sp. URMC 126 TaxID=3423401 RepID=UPI003F1CF9EB
MKPDITWRKSSKSTDAEGNCLEVARRGDAILIREGDDPDVVIRTSPTKLRALIASAGEDGPGDPA